MRSRTRIHTVLLLAGLLLPLPAAAQQSASQPVPRVSIGSIKGVPGASVMIPVTLTADPRNPLRSLVVHIEYVSNSLAFQKASLGIGAELANARIETSITELPPDDKGLKRSRLQVTASLPEPPPKDGLPGGVLAYLLFQIAEEAKPFAIRLAPAVVSAEDMATPPKKVAPIGTEPGQVAVEDPQAVYDRLAPQVACFFFTH